MPERLSLPQARRVALAAQGFADPRPAGSVDRRHLRRVLARTQLLQIDSVNVFERAHYVPLYSRLGAFPKDLLERAAYSPRPAEKELFEYWGHEASLLPVALHPLLRWRMQRAADLEEGWGRTVRIAREQPEFVADVLRRVRELGPVGAGDLREGRAVPARGGTGTRRRWRWSTCSGPGRSRPPGGAPSSGCTT